MYLVGSLHKKDLVDSSLFIELIQGNEEKRNKLSNDLNGHEVLPT